MVLGSQLTSGAVFGEQVGCRLPNASPEERVFSKLLLGIMLGASFFYTIFLYAFCKMLLFCTRKKLLGNLKKKKENLKQNKTFHISLVLFLGGGRGGGYLNFCK